MDEFDEFLNDLEETVAEEVEWGDDSSGSDAEADARAAAAPQPASVTAAVAAPSKMHTPYHGRKGSTSEAPSEEGKEGASAGNLPHVNSNATPASAEAALFAAVSMVKSEGQPRAEGVEGGEAGIQQPAGEAGQTQEEERHESKLNFNAVNAVAKTEVCQAVADTFAITPETAGEAVPRLVDVGLPADLDAFVIDDLLSSSECQALIDAAERAKMTFWDQSRENPRADYRNADTVEVQHPGSAAEMWSRIEKVLPTRSVSINIAEDSVRHQPDLEGRWDGVGTNNKLLLARYQHGGHFSPHTDGYSIVDFNHRSQYTMLVYLNECQGGGGTRFYRDEQVDKLVKDAHGRFTGQPEHVIGTVQTKPGRALCFFHNILHEGCAVEPGCVKYIIRSDLMYTRNPPICNAPNDIEAFKLYQQADELSAQGKVDESMRLYKKSVRLSPALANIFGL